MAKLEPLNDEQKQQIGSLITTEHFTLQTAQSATISEANGRASLFLSTVSSAIVALAFIGQVDKTMATFFSFAFVLFPVLIFLGIATFSRVLQLAIDNFSYMREISRLRHLYTELVPQIAPYFIMSTSDDVESTANAMSPNRWRWEMFLTTAGTVGVINSVLVGVLVGLVIIQFGAWQWLAIGIGVILAALCVLIHQRHQAGRWAAAVDATPAMFPDSDQVTE